MHIELRRYRLKGESIDGQIFIDGTKVCDCAENAHHCLPPGEYQVQVIKCHQHARKMPIIMLPACESSRVSEFQSSKIETLKPASATETLKPQCAHCKKLPFVGNNTSMPCKCVQLCPGNGVYNRTDGAILLGKYLAPGCLTHPKTAFDTLYERIRKNSERGNEITLTIQNTY